MFWYYTKSIDCFFYSWLDFILCTHICFNAYCVFDFLILQARNFNILLCLSHWICFILTPLTFIFHVRYRSPLLLLSLLYIVVDLAVFISLQVAILDNPLDNVLQTLFLSRNYLYILSLLIYIFLWWDLMLVVLKGYVDYHDF